MATHSVAGHLQLNVKEYDTKIRAFIPHYEEMFDIAIGLLNTFAPANASVLDLGGGTGALTAAIHKGCPGMSIELIDIDPTMLEQAQERLGGSERVRVTEGSFFDPLPPCDAVVASLALHHIFDPTKKVKVYESIHKALRPGGIFLNLDTTISAEESLRTSTFAYWAGFMEQNGISKTQAYQHFADWAKEDRYFSINEELRSLEQAGFKQPEVFWRRGPMTVFGGLAT